VVWHDNGLVNGDIVGRDAEYCIGAWRGWLTFAPKQEMWPREDLPVKGSVPAPMLFRYWLLGKPSKLTRYERKFYRSPEKLYWLLSATKEKTVVDPLGPLYSFQVRGATRFDIKLKIT
jgi:hypothetical protein